MRKLTRLNPRPCLATYNNLLQTLKEKYPTSCFDNRSRRLRQQKENALPAQIRRSQNLIRGWQKELAVVASHKTADLALEAAETELRLTDRLGNSGARPVDVTNPFRRRKRQRMSDDEQLLDDEAQEAAEVSSTASLERRSANLVV